MSVMYSRDRCREQRTLDASAVFLLCLYVWRCDGLVDRVPTMTLWTLLALHL